MQYFNGGILERGDTLFGVSRAERSHQDGSTLWWGMGLDPFFGVLWRSSTSFSSKRVESDLHSCPESYLSAQNIHGLEMLEIVDRTQKGKSSIALAV